ARANSIGISPIRADAPRARRGMAMARSMRGSPTDEKRAAVPSRAGARLKTLRVLARPGNRALGWLIAGPLRIPCALGRGGIARHKREGDGATPAGRFRLLWAYYRPDRRRAAPGGVPSKPLRR